MAAWLALLLLTFCSHTAAIQFTLEKNECFTFHNELTGDVIHGSFVIVNSNSWGDWEEVGLDLTVCEAKWTPIYALHRRRMSPHFYARRVLMSLPELRQFASMVDNGTLPMHLSLGKVLFQDHEFFGMAHSWSNALFFQVRDPDGYSAYTVQGKTEDEFMFAASRAGEYEFCFTNNSPIFETVALDIYFGYDKVKTHEVVKDGRSMRKMLL